MSGVAGDRGSNRRAFLLVGSFFVGTMVLLLAGYMAGSSVKQVYWAVYSRLHPMRDSPDAYGFVNEEATTVYLKAADPKKNAAQEAIRTGKKEEVRLVQSGTEKIKHRDDEKKAASEAKMRQSATESIQETEHVEDLAEQLSAKATKNFATEIEAVAGSEEADRLTGGLQRDREQSQTKLEKEAEEAAAKSSKGVARKLLGQA